MSDQRERRVRRVLWSAAVAAAATMAASPAAMAIVQDYNRARGGDGYQVTHPGNGFFQQDGAFDGAPGAQGIAGDFFFSGSDGGFVLDVRAPLGQGATWDQSANLAVGDNGGYMYMDYFKTGTAGYPEPATPPPWNVAGSFWFGGAGSDAGALPAADVFNPDLTQILAYADVIAPAGKQFEFRIASAYTGQDNGVRFVGTGTGGWQTVGGTLASGGAMGSFDTADPNLSMMVVFGAPGQPPTTWDNGGAFGSTPAIIRWDNLTLTAAVGRWTATSGGNWSDNANWDIAAPSGRNAIASFEPSATPQTVVLDSPVAAPDGDIPARNSFYVGALVLDSPVGGYTLAGTEPLVIDTTAANGTDLSGPNGDVLVRFGSHTISAPLRLNRTTEVEVQGTSSLLVSGDQTAQAGAGLIKSGPGALQMKHFRGASLAVNAGTLTVTATGGTAAGASNVGPLSIDASATLDLKDNKLITTSPAGTATGGVYDGVSRQVQRAHNAGAWNQPGLTTSMPDAASGLTSIGVGSAAKVLALGAGQTDTFAGQVVTDTSTIVMYTYRGDANLDGFISGDDYSAIDFASGTPGASGWTNGDFNWDGIISGDDYSAIDFNLVAQGAPFPTGGAAGSAGIAAVPEPGAAALAVIAAAVGAGRRRRSLRR